MKLRLKLPRKVWKLKLIGNALYVNYRQIRPGMDLVLIRVHPFQLLDQEYLWKNLLGCLNNKCFVNPVVDIWASMWTRSKTRTLIFQSDPCQQVFQVFLIEPTLCFKNKGFKLPKKCWPSKKWAEFMIEKFNFKVQWSKSKTDLK